MKFYNRTQELAEFEKLYQQSQKIGKMTVLTGRRRVGKTFLSIHFARKFKYIYLFVSKKSESLLCEEFIKEIKKGFNVPIIGKIERFSDIFITSPNFGNRAFYTHH